MTKFSTTCCVTLSNLLKIIVKSVGKASTFFISFFPGLPAPGPVLNKIKSVRVIVLLYSNTEWGNEAIYLFLVLYDFLKQ